ncbi:MAG: DUF4124 domain-containing protein [Nitrosomonadales bacterium]|nr:DUF4124 domain-containing protein [Nitrosomonadales bacterium]
MKNSLFVLLLLCAVNAHAGLSKWVDAEGNVHYSDMPPPANAQAKTLRAVPAAGAAAQEAKPGSAPSAAKTYVEREAELKKAQLAKKEAADRAAQEQAAAQAQAENCAAARQNLRTLQEMPRISELDANGERIFLSDEQRQQRIEKAQQTISSLCK